MNKKDFERLVKGVGQMKSILAREAAPSREVSVNRIRATRIKLKMTQKAYAGLLQISVATLRNWEQGRVMPDGPARALLTIAEKRPDALEVLHA